MGVLGLRADGYVPPFMYGENERINFLSSANFILHTKLFRKLDESKIGHVCWKALLKILSFQCARFSVRSTIKITGVERYMLESMA